MIKVHIEMDQVFNWWPISEQALDSTSSAPTMMVDEEWFNKFNAVSAAARELQQEVEQLFRLQQGMRPLTNATIPNHKMITPTLSQE